MKTRLIPAVLFGLTSALPCLHSQSPDAAPATPPAQTAPAAPTTAAAEHAAAPATVAAPAPAAQAAPAQIREVAAAPEVAGPAEAAPALSQGATAAPVVAGPIVKSKDTLTVDFPDDDIRNILRSVADLFDLNLVVPETLQGKASIKLREVTWKQIFKVVLNPVGYTYVEDGNIIRIVSADSLVQEPPTTEIFVLNYAKAADVKPSIDNLVEVKAGGKIVVDARSNSLLVTERPSVINRIRPLIASLDRATDQVMIETKFIDVTQTDQHDLGINWASLQKYSIGTKGAMTQKYEGTESGGVNAITKTTNAVLTADQFALVLSAMTTLGKSRLVSNPTVVTLNNTEATINIGREYPIPNYTYNQTTGQFEVSGFTYRPIGVNLKVTPQVNTAGFIRLTVEPEVSSSNENVSFGGQSATQIPIIQVRKTKTQITLKDGYTLGIGGLVEQTSTTTDSKIPGLGSIPYVGRLFKTKSKSGNQHNLVVFITAKTVRPDGAATGEIFDPRETRKMGLEQGDLPGARDGSNPYAAPEPEEGAKH